MGEDGREGHTIACAFPPLIETVALANKLQFWQSSEHRDFEYHQWHYNASTHCSMHSTKTRNKVSALGGPRDAPNWICARRAVTRSQPPR
eukprot:3545564-Rhodomonas_salina.1